MSELPPSRAEKVEAIKDRLMQKGGIKFNWGGYSAIIGKGYESGDNYRIFLFITSSVEGTSYLNIHLDRNMEPIGMEHIFGNMSELIKRRIDVLPQQLRNCGPKIVEFILNQNSEDTIEEFGGWAL